MRGVWAALAALFLAASGASAQELQPTPSSILTLDQDRLFNETLWGQRAARRIEEASTELAAENRSIEAELTAEEKALTEQRATMTAEAFRAAADSFDARVTEIRQTQDAKARDIGRMTDTERQRFLAAAFPVIGEVVRSRGAVAVLDSRAIFLSAEEIDVTDAVIARLDEVLGAGEDAPEPTEERTSPDPDAGAPSGD